jgi:carbon-monoxide dehydrogenase small subunit
MADEHAPKEEIRDDQAAADSSEEESTAGSGGKVSRRQFLVGAGSGLVIGAAGAAGVLTIVRPPPTVQEAKPAQPQPGTPPQVASVASDLPPTMRRVTLNINSKDYEVVTDVRQSLWEVMTYDLGMAGANLGCDRAQCGACTVLVDGRPMNSCALLAARLGKGQKILTVEGLGKGNRVQDLHPIQRAFWQEGGAQCGLCTRGLIMSTYALLTKNPSPSEDDVREALSGNICRCSEYPKIYESVFRAADDMRKAKG